jgi:Tat protein translocase TatB subunit
MFLFIFESIGTSELMLIGVVALIFLGPRKLPQMAKTLGKMMAEFRKTTNDFKTTWEREVVFEELDSGTIADPPVPVARISEPAVTTPTIAAPSIREVDEGEFDRAALTREPAETPAVESQKSQSADDKRNWL